MEKMMDEKREMKDEILTFKVSGEEAEMIRKAAAKDGVSVSQHIRTCVLYVSFKQGDPVAVRVFTGGVNKAVKEFIEKVTRIQTKGAKARS
jgi:hypothetical protein